MNIYVIVIQYSHNKHPWAFNKQLLISEAEKNMSESSG